MKIIFVTGGVLSGIGKGISAASIGVILKSMGYTVFCQKFDGYLNVDPWTMSPFQHGEVFVTEDGTETDLDLGHYERFLDIPLTELSSFTSWKLYEELIRRERRGDFLGGTVQIVPHLTDLVKEKIRDGFQSSEADISIVEIGGTVGDMENEYILESARQIRTELWSENVIFVHVALLPFLLASKELKTKPIQHSIRTLMGYGIVPDFLVVRADSDIPDDTLDKIAKASWLPRQHVLGSPTLDSIYRVPIEYAKSHIGESVVKALALVEKTPHLGSWEQLVENIDASTDTLRIGMIGKYVELEDAYYSVNEAMKSAGFFFQKKVKLIFIEAESIEKQWTTKLESLDGICVPWWFGGRGIEGMLLAAEYARVHDVPYLGICLGSQIMAIEFARNVLELRDANSEEFDPDGKNNVVHIMENQKWLTKKWGTMRLGKYECIVRTGTLADRLYSAHGQTTDWLLRISERHRHRYEFNRIYRDRMEERGFIVSATSPDGTLAEIVELKDHPFMIGTQAHPEFHSRPTQPHPLFLGFIDASIRKSW